VNSLRSVLRPSANIRSIIFVRLAVGIIFLTQGILKYIDPHMGVMRFIPLLIVILTAIATTKITEFFHANQGFWFMVSDARTDFAMTLSLLFSDQRRRRLMVS